MNEPRELRDVVTIPDHVKLDDYVGKRLAVYELEEVLSRQYGAGLRVVFTDWQDAVANNRIVLLEAITFSKSLAADLGKLLAETPDGVWKSEGGVAFTLDRVGQALRVA